MLLYSSVMAEKVVPDGLIKVTLQCTQPSMVRAILTHPDPGDGDVRKYIGYVIDSSTQSRFLGNLPCVEYSDVAIKVDSPHSCSNIHTCILTRFLLNLSRR